jgi:hypothetical protein
MSCDGPLSFEPTYDGMATNLPVFASKTGSIRNLPYFSTFSFLGHWRYFCAQELPGGMDHRRKSCFRRRLLLLELKLWIFSILSGILGVFICFHNFFFSFSIWSSVVLEFCQRFDFWWMSRCWLVLSLRHLSFHILSTSCSKTIHLFTNKCHLVTNYFCLLLPMQMPYKMSL